MKTPKKYWKTLKISKFLKTLKNVNNETCRKCLKTSVSEKRRETWVMLRKVKA